MFKVGEYVVYKKDVCMIKEIKKNLKDNNDYYTLIPTLDETLKIKVPILNQFGNIRSLINKKEIEDIIKAIPAVEIINYNNKLIENEYKRLLSSGNHMDLIKIIKTAYLRNKERTDNNKKIGDKDNDYFCMAERYLYNEFSIVLGMSYDDTKKYVIGEVNKFYSKE